MEKDLELYLVINLSNLEVDQELEVELNFIIKFK